MFFYPQTSRFPHGKFGDLADNYEKFQRLGVGICSVSTAIAHFTQGLALIPRTRSTRSSSRWSATRPVRSPELRRDDRGRRPGGPWYLRVIDLDGRNPARQDQRAGGSAATLRSCCARSGRSVRRLHPNEVCPANREEGEDPCAVIGSRRQDLISVAEDRPRPGDIRLLGGDLMLDPALAAQLPGPPEQPSRYLWHW